VKKKEKSIVIKIFMNGRIKLPLTSAGFAFVAAIAVRLPNIAQKHN
jgi:hypothetical protein